MNRLFIASLAAGAFLLSSCSSDEPFAGPDANGGKVTFIAEFPTETLTRDFGDGTQAKKLSYAIYEVDAEGNASGTPLFATGQADSPEPVALADNKGFSLEVTLIKGQTYNVVFWADAASDSPYTFSAADHNISVSYEGAVANDEGRDAFFQSIKNYTAENSATVPVTLKRPFAQVNFGTADLESLPGKVTVSNVSLKVTNVYDRLDLFSGVASASSGEPAEVTFAAADLPKQAFPEIEGSDKTYSYLEMNYILTGTDIVDNDVQQAQGELVECTVTAALSSGRNAVFNINNVPVQRNYRTNIYGNLLTSKTDYQISVDAGFENDIVVDAELKALADQGGEYVLKQDKNAGNTGILAQSEAVPLSFTADEAVLDLNGHTLNGTYIEVKGHLTVKNSDADNTGTFTAPQYAKPGTMFPGYLEAESGVPMFVVKEGGELEFDNADITAKINSANRQEIIRVEKGGKLTINSSTITAPRSRVANSSLIIVDQGVNDVYIEDSDLSSSGAVLQTNYDGVTTGNPRIAVKNSRLQTINDYNAIGSAVIIDIPCRFIAVGTHIESSLNGLTVRQGTATLTDCEIVSSLRDVSDYDIAVYCNLNQWGKGVATAQGALVVGNYVKDESMGMVWFDPDNYSAPVTVNLRGTTKVTSAKPTQYNAIVVRAKDSSSSAVTMDVANTCTVTGLVKFLGGQINATGISASE
ncbi:MAG: hypothetical protein J6C59_06265 [Muribaculaceae bacterium]|nr:hypothetical protein [Muribaculaceae bacterium]